MEFTIKGNQFMRDGSPVQIRSGAVHYFRNMPDTWDDIFEKMRAMGLNCVETYTAWNMHEPRPGEFCFEGHLDIAAFIRKAGEHGLMAIVRPGPYICAEWEFGGLPWWIQCEDDIEIRCMNETYIRYFDRYLDHLFDELRPLLCTKGGPIIMLQCENEYGYYGDDREYLAYLRDGYRRRGMDVLLFTSDGHAEGVILDGTVEGCLPTLNFGSGVAEKFEAHDRLFPDVPKMCAEMWDGWFDAWGDDHHHTTSPEAYLQTARDMYEKGSANIYMFIGGTNFGFTGGANHSARYTPQVTSYDYDALLSECGDTTPKYHAMRALIREMTGEELPPVPPDRPKAAYGEVALNETAPLMASLDSLSSPISSNVPLPMESYGIGYGFILYKTRLNRDYRDATLSFEGIGDRAHVYVEDRLMGIVYVNDESFSLSITASAGEYLYILVENLGRANFGSKMMRKKGIDGRLLLDTKIHFGWQAYPLPMDNLDRLTFRATPATPSSVPGFFRGRFTVDRVADTFLRLDNFKKGFVLINGFNIGRYWEIGPQKTLYIPASLLHEGENEILLFESDGLAGTPTVTFVDQPELG